MYRRRAAHDVAAEEQSLIPEISSQAQTALDVANDISYSAPAHACPVRILRDASCLESNNPKNQSIIMLVIDLNSGRMPVIFPQNEDFVLA
jgi:hypothetical protein